MIIRPDPFNDKYIAQLNIPVVTSQLRFYATKGDGLYSVSEIQAFGTPVPEPSTYIAGLSALVMLGLFGWRNRK
jgi:hypothetical protein